MKSKEYVDHVLRYYQVLNTGGTYPANGMQIPLYIQTEYGNIPYGTGSIADCGCGPTAFAMVASYLTGSTITPVDAVAWCGKDGSQDHCKTARSPRYIYAKTQIWGEWIGDASEPVLKP